MEPEDILFRIAYVLLFITLALMTWAVSVQAGDVGVAEALKSPSSIAHQDSPCSFNPLCTCSKPGPSEYGIVSCISVPFGTIPSALNDSRTFILSLENNGLQLLDAKSLFSSGLWRLEIKHNRLHRVHEDAFAGLAKFLTELNLGGNQLTEIPTDALSSLSKLRMLDLSGNKIADVEPELIERLPPSLSCLSLANNVITAIVEGAFEPLPKLERLDLSGNSIALVEPQAFPPTLNHLHLGSNLLRKIPFEALSSLQLQTLDLSSNLITSTFDTFYQGKLNVVGQVDLSRNRIDSVPAFSLQNFKQAGALDLSYNPIGLLGDDAFKGGATVEINLSNCHIHEIYPRAFRGLENSLKRLDLSYNNVSYLPLGLFTNFGRLKELILDENRVGFGKDEMDQVEFVTRLSLLGDKIPVTLFQELSQLKNLRGLNISSILMNSLSPKLFDGFGSGLQHLKISFAKVNAIMNSAFSELPGLKSLDLSENRIGRIEDGAFEHIGHSLQSLDLTNSIRMTTISPAALQKLQALESLKMGSNQLASLADTSFSNSEKLVHLDLRFNKLSSISSKLFEHSKIPRLKWLSLSFNQLKELAEETFHKLNDLEYIELNDNLIGSVGRRAFTDLPSVKIVNLAGNKINHLNDEAFENLPHLKLLDLSWNGLTKLNLEAFEQLGTLSSLKVDVSWNKIVSLGNPITQNISKAVSIKPPAGSPSEDEIPSPISTPLVISSSSIESLDISHNNISFISPSYLFPLSNTLIELYLSHNQLSNLTSDHLGSMRFLQKVDVSHNNIDTIEYDAFRDAKWIQIADFSYNLIRDFPPDLFEDCRNLRVFYARGNKIRSMADSLFKDSKLEILDLAGNQIVRFPESALARISSTLVHVDLSGNEISSISSTQVECLQKLLTLNLANNRIVIIADDSFDSLHSLLSLNLGSNPVGRLNSRLFDHLTDTLLHLTIANMSLESLPDFEKFPYLLTFNASHNSLSYLPTNFGVNVSRLRTLDVAGNEIVSTPNVIWHTIPRLLSVDLSMNPIRTLANDSFLQLERLRSLDVSHLPFLDSVQVGTLAPLVCLSELRIGPEHGASAAVGAVIQNVESLESLHFEVMGPMISKQLLNFPLPPKLSKVIISGERLLSIGNEAFGGITSRAFTLVIEGTGLADLGEGITQKIGDATDLTIELGGDNPILKTIGNPSVRFRPSYGVPYLKNLILEEGFSLSCSCDSGWIEFWLRQWIERTCPVQPNSSPESCDKYMSSMRSLQCGNKLNTRLFEAFITELDCGWDSGSKRIANPDLLKIFSVIFVLKSF